MTGRGVEARADWDHLRTPEADLEPRPYGFPKHLPLNHWALACDWTIESEKVVLD